MAQLGPRSISLPCAPAAALTVAALEKPAHPAQRSTINNTVSAGKSFVLGHQICLLTRGPEEGDYQARNFVRTTAVLQARVFLRDTGCKFKNETFSANISGRVASSSCGGHVSRSGSSRVWFARSDAAALSHLGWEKPEVC